MSNRGEFIYAVAKAINGPHYDDGINNLDAQRNERWAAASVEHKRRLLQQARAAIAQIESGGKRAVALEKPNEVRDLRNRA